MSYGTAIVSETQTVKRRRGTPREIGSLLPGGGANLRTLNVLGGRSDPPSSWYYGSRGGGVKDVVKVVP